MKRNILEQAQRKIARAWKEWSYFNLKRLLALEEARKKRRPICIGFGGDPIDELFASFLNKR